MITKLNLSTPSVDIIDTMKEETSKAIYWFIKQVGGKKRYEALRDNLIDKSRRNHGMACSQIVEWKSSKGNRWLVYECANFYDVGVNCVPMAFCYYETLGSVGLFLEAYNLRLKQMETYIFTSHFFERWCERKYIKMNGRNTIVDFLKLSPGFIAAPYEDDEEGLRSVDIRLDGCICRGVQRDDSNLVFEIRTILTDEQLTSKQKMYTRSIRERGDVMKKYIMPQEFVKPYILSQRNITEEENKANTHDLCTMTGLTEDEVHNMLKYSQAIVHSVAQLIGKDFLDIAFNEEMQNKIARTFMVELNKDIYSADATKYYFILVVEYANKLGYNVTLEDAIKFYINSLKN